MKKQDEFSTSSHFHHPGSDSGPRSAPSQNPERKTRDTFRIKIIGNEQRKQYYFGRIQNQEDLIAKRQAAIMLFGILSNMFLIYYLEKRKKEKYANQFRDIEQTKDFIYIDVYKKP